MEEFAKLYVPLISAVISLVSVSIALTALRYSRQDRREQQRIAELDALSSLLQGPPNKTMHLAGAARHR